MLTLLCGLKVQIKIALVYHLIYFFLFLQIRRIETTVCLLMSWLCRFRCWIYVIFLIFIFHSNKFEKKTTYFLNVFSWGRLLFLFLTNVTFLVNFSVSESSFMHIPYGSLTSNELLNKEGMLNLFSLFPAILINLSRINICSSISLNWSIFTIQSLSSFWSSSKVILSTMLQCCKYCRFSNFLALLDRLLFSHWLFRSSRFSLISQNCFNAML